MFELPAHHTAREAEIVASVTEDLRRRGVLQPTDEPQIAAYAAATVESERLTAEARRWPPESQESRRITAAAERSRRNASTLANRLKITASARRTEKSADTSGSLLDLLREVGML
jgi:cell division septation protein DedD